MGSTLPAFVGGIVGWWASDKFLGLPWVPAFPKDNTSLMVLFCTLYLLMGLEEVRRAVSKST